MIGAHTDSPCLRIKPVSKKQGDGFLQVGVECYGGGLWHTWFDRDLGIAGRVMAKAPDGSLVQKLVKIDRPILRIPSLAVHLDRQVPFDFNKETQLFPIAGLAAAEFDSQGCKSSENTKQNSEAPKDEDPTEFAPLKAMTDRHHAPIVELIAREIGIDATDLVDIECVLFDTQKAAVGGVNNELVFSARLDNLGMSYCSTMGLIESLSSASSLDQDSSIRLIALFDHEEVGSLSAQGADSNLLPSVIRRLCALPMAAIGSAASDDSYERVPKSEDVATAYEQTLSTSFLVSADMAHSVHPNYPGKYESDHRPHMNKGTVIKVNANQKYSTNSPGIVLVQECARRAGVLLQLFVVRQDSMCGSTIGPMLAGALGARTLDLGNAQLSMHSIRETGGAHDVDHSIKLFETFFTNYAELETKIIVD